MRRHLIITILLLCFALSRTLEHGSTFMVIGTLVVSIGGYATAYICIKFALTRSRIAGFYETMQSPRIIALVWPLALLAVVRGMSNASDFLRSYDHRTVAYAFLAAFIASVASAFFGRCYIGFETEEWLEAQLQSCSDWKREIRIAQLRAEGMIAPTKHDLKRRRKLVKEVANT